MAHQSLPDRLIIRADAVLTHIGKHRSKDLFILRNAQFTILHRDNAVRARCVKSRHRHPVPVRADRELCLIAVTIRLLHPHNLLHHGINEFRRKSSDTDQIAAHLFLLIAKLLPIVHRLDLAAAAARIQRTFRLHTVRRRF